MLFLDSIKRAARQEAWYGDSNNPFRKTTRRSTFPAQPLDEEKNVGMGQEGVLRPVSTEPGPRGESSYSETREFRPRADEEKANAEPRPSDPSTDETIVARESSRQPSEEQVARKRFINRLWKRKDKEPEMVDGEEKPKKKRGGIFAGKELKHEPFTLRNQLQNTIGNSWINVLLIAAPVGIALNYAGVNKIIVFVVNFIAIIPLAAMLSFATEELALHVGESLGGLLNASFGNAVEMIVAIIALAKGEVVVVQTSLIGSILSNLLLVMGMCFFFGGLRRTEQFFNQTVAQTAASLLALAVASVIIPTAFNWSSETTNAPIAAISRGTSVILLVIYAGYLYFQLHTHATMFNEESQKVPMRPRKNALPEGALARGLAKAGGIGAGPGRANMPERPPHDELINAEASLDEEDEPEEPQLHILVAWATLAGATAIIGLCAEFMVDSISAVTDSGHVSVEFVGLILLPIVGNAAEHATAVTVACKDKMDLAIGVAVGSSMQVALLLIPLMVVIGWIMGNDMMSLSFDGFQVAVLFMAVLLVNYLIGDGKSHWLEGMLLQCLYIIIAVCAWYYPVKEGETVA
ncbi:putative Ca2+-transport (H+ Ca2+ exchange) protein [Rutstroemia sp. NJR-2017a BBW]|nr:putative Ca2+-transport (H+ Ca2+ exchange) protein [Rutstroemia sp. NJR-2017a BBW]